MKNNNKALPLLLLLVVLFLISSPIAMASSASPAATVHIVYTEKPQDIQDLDSFHLRTLSTVLGSEEAARQSMVHVYRTVANGFSAKLTPEQVQKLSQLPGVLQVVPSQTLQLHQPGGV